MKYVKISYSLSSETSSSNVNPDPLFPSYNKSPPNSSKLSSKSHQIIKTILHAIPNIDKWKVRVAPRYLFLAAYVSFFPT